MRVYSCFVRRGGSPVPSLSFVFARDEQRALELARRELAETPDALAVEICEEGRLLAVEAGDAAA